MTRYLLSRRLLNIGENWYEFSIIIIVTLMILQFCFVFFINFALLIFCLYYFIIYQNDKMPLAPVEFTKEFIEDITQNSGAGKVLAAVCNIGERNIAI